MGGRGRRGYTFNPIFEIYIVLLSITAYIMIPQGNHFGILTKPKPNSNHPHFFDQFATKLNSVWFKISFQIPFGSKTIGV